MNAGQSVMTAADLDLLPVPRASERIAYGEGPLRFGDLYLPEGGGPFPVVVLVHGGCWLAKYDLSYLASFAAEFARRGAAVWSLEYRRIGDEGGGFPGTFEDVARGADALAALAARVPLDLSRAVAVGHSAGGHLALWLAARHRLPAGSPLATPTALRLRGVVSLAGIADLRDGSARALCDGAIAELLGGAPDEVPERLRAASPAESLPLGLPQRLLCGELDDIVPADHVQRYREAAAAAGDDARIEVLAGCGHFELAVPGSRAWPAVCAAVFELLGESPTR